MCKSTRKTKFWCPLWSWVLEGWVDLDDDEKEDRIFCSIVFRQSENKEEANCKIWGFFFSQFYSIFQFHPSHMICPRRQSGWGWLVVFISQFCRISKNEQFHPFCLIRFALIPHPQKKYWISFTVWIVDVLSLRSPLDHLSSFHHWDLGGAFKRSRRQACQYRVHKPYRNQYGHTKTMKKMMMTMLMRAMLTRIVC